VVVREKVSISLPLQLQQPPSSFACSITTLLKVYNLVQSLG